MRGISQGGGQTPGQPDQHERNKCGLGTQRPGGWAKDGEEGGCQVGFQAAKIRDAVKIDGEMPLQNALGLNPYQRLVSIDHAVRVNNQK